MNKAAKALGRLAKGVPKKYSPEELDRRRIRIAAARAKIVREHPDKHKSK